ncbi:hypothetical protein [Almyronema epifaneia]|uniref:Uncharacterized protein n=1 Tax=Almyronema epifaneia S1 TaxID=2991925 RepID=A0ABW6II40_9CYAN
MRKKLWGGFVVGLGYMLSPLSWWNDLFFNLPIAYGFGYGLSWLQADWFLPGTVAGYWLSNLLGFLLMQWGAGDLFFSDRPRNFTQELWLSLGTSTLYTAIIVGLFYFNLMQLPEFLAFN